MLSSKAVTVSLSFLLTAQLAVAAVGPDTRSFDAVPNKATPAADSGIVLESAEVPLRRSLHGAFLLDFNFGILALKLGEDKLGNLIPARIDGHLHFAYQLLKRLELSADLPVTLWQADNFKLLRDEGFDIRGINAVGLGDIRAMGRYQLFSQVQLPVALAAVLEVRAPTGDGISFLGDRGMVLAPRALVERRFGRVRVLGNVGFRFRKPTQFLNLYVGNELTAGAGAIVDLPDAGKLTRIQAIGELHLATPTEEPFNFSHSDALKSPLEALVGIRARFAKRFSAEVDIGRGLNTSAGYGREAFRLITKIAYDFEPEDRDRDGVEDDKDRCPDTPEDLDGFQDDDGCPDPDNDSDGIPDGQDVCPMDAGLREYDGCPDRDADQVPDNVDRCPDQFGPADNEGCPVQGPSVKLEARRLRIKNNVLFETGSAQVRPESFPILDEVYTFLSQHPEIGQISVDGHTDNRGSRPYNLDLSQRRATSVVDYLMKKGIAPERLTSKGFGFDKPVDTNATPLGRAKNRRVEFNVLDEAVSDGPAAPKADAR